MLPNTANFGNRILRWVLFGLTGLAYALQGDSQKLIKANDPPQITDAVMITEISVANKSVQCGLFLKPPSVFQSVTPFEADSNWVRNISISLFNRTIKKIVAGAITLQFLDTGDCHTSPCAAEEMHIGQQPAADAYNGRTGQPMKSDNPQRAALNWKPGQTINVHVSDYMAEIEKNLENQIPLASVKTIAVHIGPFFFPTG